MQFLWTLYRPFNYE